jgi:hypothetical protein
MFFLFSLTCNKNIVKKTGYPVILTKLGQKFFLSLARQGIGDTFNFHQTAQISDPGISTGVQTDTKKPPIKHGIEAIEYNVL